MDVDKFDFSLPSHLIAQKPVKERDTCRLLVYDRGKKEIIENIFKNIGEYFKKGDLLVINETRVRPARLHGKKAFSGGKVEVLLLYPGKNELEWHCLVKPGRRLKPGTVVLLGTHQVEGEITGYTERGGRTIRFSCSQKLENLLEKEGELPLPPYIKETLENPEDYQTVYSKIEGSVAAPTAGLHFTRQLLLDLEKRGVGIVSLLLHIGPGTFQPVETEEIEAHKMHSEYMEIPAKTAQAINDTRETGGRIVAVGTTVLRSLESVADERGRVSPYSGWTDLFIYPGYRFKAVDVLLTNFHLPRTTLLMLVCAFGGYGEIMEIYEYAARREYRFFSFGDAMLIL